MSYIEANSPQYRRVFFSMLLGSTVTFAVLYGPQTLIQTFSKEFQISPSTASFVISFATFSLAVSMLAITLFVNAFGRKQLMGISLLLTSVLNIITAFSPNFHVLLLLRILQGCSLAGFPAIAMTYLSEEISKSYIGRLMGVYVSGCALGAFVGRVVVSTLTDFFHWNLAILLLGALSLLCSVLFWIYLPESRHFSKKHFSFAAWTSGLFSGFRDKKLLYLYAMGFILLGIYVALFNYISFTLSKPPFNLSDTLIGFLFVCQLAGSWSSYFFGKLTERFSRTRLITVAVVMLLAGSLLTLSGHIVMVIIGLILYASGFLAAHSIASGWIGFISQPAAKAYASSLYLFFYYIGSSVIGWLGGVFLNSWGWGGVISMIGGLIVLIGLLIAALRSSLRTLRINADQRQLGRIN